MYSIFSYQEIVFCICCILYSSESEQNMKWLHRNTKYPINDVLKRFVRYAGSFVNYTSNSKQNFIDGKLCNALDNSRPCDNINPATGEKVGEFYLSGEADVDLAVKSSKEAFESWSERSASERSTIIRKAGEIIAQNKDDIAKLETIDSGEASTIYFLTGTVY